MDKPAAICMISLSLSFSVLESIFLLLRNPFNQISKHAASYRWVKGSVFHILYHLTSSKSGPISGTWDQGSTHHFSLFFHHISSSWSPLGFYAARCPLPFPALPFPSVLSSSSSSSRAAIQQMARRTRPKIHLHLRPSRKSQRL